MDLQQSKTKYEVHPLFNAVVLKNIFSLLRVPTLKNVRLVCSSWNEEASPYLQTLSEVVLIRGKHLDKRRYSYANFLSYIEDIPVDEIFFRNYHIQHWIFNEKRERSFSKFWSKCGSSMKELYLKDIIFYEIGTLRDVLYHRTPNLVSLGIEECLFYTVTEENIPSDCEGYSNPEDFDEDSVFFDYYDHVRVEKLQEAEIRESFPNNSNFMKLKYQQLTDESFPLPWEEVFSAFPQTKEIRIAANTPVDQIGRVMRGLKFSHLSSSSFITTLSFFHFRNSPSLINDDSVQLLNSCLQSQLSSLELSLDKVVNVSPDLLHKLLNNHRTKLKHLSIYVEDEEELQWEQSPLLLGHKLLIFPKLITLNISLNVLSGCRDILSLNRSMPVLQTLNLWKNPEDFSWESTIDQQVAMSSSSDIHVHQTVLKLSFKYGFKSKTFINMLSVTFENLRVLKVPLNDEQIREVFLKMKNLGEIVVYDRYLTDSGITGDPVELHEELEWSPKFQRKYSYIGDLKNLQRFELEYWKYDDITDLSIYHGFMEVPNLSSLSLTKTKISNQALNQLCWKSNLTTLIANKKYIKGVY